MSRRTFRGELVEENVSRERVERTCRGELFEENVLRERVERTTERAERTCRGIPPEEKSQPREELTSDNIISYCTYLHYVERLNV
jgi:hypothetical protein